MITNTGAAWIREMMRIEAEGNREFDLMIHVFRALDPTQEQREAIEEWWTQKTYQQGLLGEAVNEHRLYPQIRAAFVAGNTAELGRLVDQAVREYCGEVMELDQ